MPKVVATVECRMTSSRLPGKVMMRSQGKPMLEYLVERLRKIERVDEIVLATTQNSDDDCIVDLAKRIGVKYFRGSEEDVLKRVLLAAESVNADLIMEITGDCPVLDPNISAQVLDLYLENKCDFAANWLKQSFPLGMETQVFSTELLRQADQQGHLPEDREHVCWFFIRQPERFKLLMLPAPQDLNYPELRLTLDEIDDFRLIDNLILNLGKDNHIFTCHEIIQYLQKNKDLIAINQNVVQRVPTIDKHGECHR